MIKAIEHIPHRPPFLFVDEVIEYDQNKLTAKKYFSGEEDFYRGHYPSAPLTPGVLLVESLLQCGALFMSLNSTDSAAGKTPVVTRIKEVKFKNMAIPPVKLDLEIEVVESMGEVIFFKGKVKQDSKTLLTAEFAVAMVDKK